MKEAAFYKKLDKEYVKCNLCPHNCTIAPRKRGRCNCRVNKDGRLYSENYGQVSAIGIDPIEKKPLYHFYPGEEILSVGTFGCNFCCGFCQNWQISQKKPEMRKIMPEELVNMAITYDSIGIAYTYSEPSVWFEYIWETSRLAVEQELKNIMITNGYISQIPLEELLEWIDAMNIDLKAFNKGFYQKLCGGNLKPVKETIIKVVDKGVHLEITTLIIPGENDDPDEMKEMFSWLASVNENIPLHLSRYYPRYKMKKPATSIKKIEEIYSLAKEQLNYVYLGNINTPTGGITYCPDCQAEVIIRNYYNIENRLMGNKCPQCGQVIYGQF